MNRRDRVQKGKAKAWKERSEFEAHLGAHDQVIGRGIHQEPNPDDDSFSFEQDDSDSDFNEFLVDDCSSWSDPEETSDFAVESDWNSDDEDEIIVQKEYKKKTELQIQRLPFLPQHKAAFKTHSVHCDFRKSDKIIANFVGGGKSQQQDQRVISSLSRPERGP